MKVNIHPGCGRLGCSAPRGTWQVIVCFGAKGHRLTTENTVRAELGIAFCDEHKDFFSAAEFMKINGERLKRDFAALGKAEPDVDNAWIEMRPVLGPVRQ